MQSPTDIKGSMAEGAILAALVKLGKTVLIPFGGGHAYDFAIDVGDGRIARVQCKHGGGAFEDKIRFKTSRRGGCYRGLADFFAIYAPMTGKVYWVPVEGVSPNFVELRVRPPKNRQGKRIRFAADYEIEKCLG